MPTPRASVYWDLDSCIPRGETAAETIGAIRWKALRARTGEIRSIKAYHSGLNEPARPGHLDELKLMSVDIIDTRFLGGEECTVKCIQVDMLIEMMDITKSPPTLLVISDNKSMNYPINLLQNRHRKVELITRADLEAAIQHVQAHPEAGQVPLAVSASGHEGNDNNGPSDEREASSILPSLPPQYTLSQAVQARFAIPQLQSTPQPNTGAAPLPGEHRLAIPEKFIPLVEALNQARAQGNDQVLKPQLGNMIMAISRNAYTLAGVTNFKRYITMAEKEGIVEVGGGGVGEWVALKSPSM